ncbi:hypothetical protein GCM10009119_06500 [Algoriphagus jejuensis]|uniref:DUF6089 domain-containing protein n=1 Tax=Algoriphagus jejuensis TaxID=419934 RepID=A0ABN1MWH7_9BACT
MKKVNFKIIRHLLVFILVFAGYLIPAKAQQYEIGGGIGVGTYTGDIIRKVDPGQIGLQGTFFGKRNFDNVWSLRAAISSSIFSADDRIRPIDTVALVRSSRFRGGAIEGSAVMEFNFLNFLGYSSEFRWSPYAFFGLGYSYFIVKGNTYEYLDSERYDFGSVVIPFGGGVKYRLNDRWTMAAELGFRPTMTDYLDKIDSTLPAIPRNAPPVDPNTGQIPPFGINYGNPYTKDWYYFMGLTISYTITSVKCFAY